MLGTITNMKRRKARASKQAAATGQKPQALTTLRSIKLPTPRPELIIGTGVGLLAAWGILTAWDAITPLLSTFTIPTPAWLQPAVTAIGNATWLGFIAAAYGTVHAARHNIKRLSANIGHALLITGAAAPTLHLSGFNGGNLGAWVADNLQTLGAQPAWVAAACTLLAIASSTRMGDPLTKLAKLFDLTGAAITSLLPGKQPEAAPAKPQPAAPTGQQEKMQALLNARSLNYITVNDVKPGPVMTTYLVSTTPDKDLKPLTRESKKIGTTFRASGEVSIIEHVYGTNGGAIEVPNASRKPVLLADLMATEAWQTYTKPLPIILGADTYGNPKIASLPDLIHLLVAGTTGMGKSVMLNSFLLSMMAKSHPDMLRLRLIDPKMLELNLYEKSPFLDGEIITDMSKVRPMLEGLIDEMEHRYGLMQAARVRNIAAYNAKKPDAPLPYIVTLFEEFADMIMLDRMIGKMTKVKDEDGQEVDATESEELIIRLAQKARAAGMHLMPTTQRPEKDVITPLIRSNIPSRIALHVMSKGDSNIILNQPGAENLLDNGDALGLFPGCTTLQRFHGALVTETEVEAAVRSQLTRYN